ncbi:hypothetical protein NIES4071_03750 [Calothrix sp. NIES-4071]|nr:hypothetical protein NIES4071_03750 [Calothrix sp. NIES-4071]BAZ54721.1 hypothetical protein NIES4105_03740 [Calothrix sp. NIES-4105]
MAKTLVENIDQHKGYLAFTINVGKCEPWFTFSTKKALLIIGALFCYLFKLEILVYSKWVRTLLLNKRQNLIDAKKAGKLR